MLLRQRIERFLKRTGMTPSRFGREVLNDSHFVSKLREGRRVREKTRIKVKAWLDRHESRR
jgi:ketosteroid isomerase-like protein